MKASAFTRGLLQTSDFTLTYAYGVPLSQKNTFYFGLSGGVISNNIDTRSLDSSDPAINSYLADNIQPAANFGMLLRTGSGINLGASLPQLFAPKFNSPENFSAFSPSPIDNIIVSAYYARKVEGKLVSRKKRGVRRKIKTKETNAPLELYAVYKYAKAGNSQAEGTVKLNLSENFWVAGLYRQSYGFAGSLGFAFSNIMLNYSYEPGTQPQPQFSTGTHEVHLAFRIGEAKTFKRIAPVLRSTLKTAPTEQHTARFQTTDDPDVIESQKDEKKKYYVVVRSFNDFTSADAFKKKLIGDKYNANVFYYEKDKKYHVYIYESGKQGEAHEEARNLKNYTKLKDVRVLTVTVTND